MQSARSRFIAAAIAASALAIAGCNAGGISPSLPSDAAAGVANGSSSPDAATAYTYTCQSIGGSDCLVYKNGKLSKTIKNGPLDGPLGVAAGNDGLFYVANGAGANVLVYSAGGKSLKSTLDNGGNVAVDVAVYKDAVAVANQHSMTFFSAGAKTPTRTLKDSDVQRGNGAAFDSKGNCYWSLSTQKSGTVVDEFKACKGKAVRLKVNTGSPYGIAFDDKGNLWYASYSSAADGVYTCKGTTSCKRVYSQFIDPQYLNFSSDYSDLWVSDPGNYQYGAALYEVQVSNGKVLKKITQGLSFFDPPSGVAVGPGPL